MSSLVSVLAWFVAGVNTVACAVLVLFGINMWYLVLAYYRTRAARLVAPPPPASWPRVVIQLPLYNEPAVVDRLISAVTEVTYPRERLEIQILDDSTDETTERVEALAARLRAEGWTVSVHHRTNRHGYKAGALQQGLEAARAELITIFDADFLPPKDFLLRTVPYFADPKVGMVQARWDHLNRGDSLVTTVAALMLDMYLVVEQRALSRTDHLFRFNGTAGIWRRATIDESGGWLDRTLNEDADLSYRAQLNGWRFVYLDDLVCGSELPQTMTDFRLQQARWTKGATQAALVLWRAVLRSSLGTRQKLEGLLQLSSMLVFPAVLATIVLTLPMSLLYGYTKSEPLRIYINVLGACVQLATGSYIVAGLLGLRDARASDRRQRLWIPVLLAVGAGLTPLLSRSIVEALAGIDSPWLRTPKNPGAERSAAVAPAGAARAATFPVLEGTLAIYCVIAAIVVVQLGIYLWLPDMIFYAAGFALVCWLTVTERVRFRPRADVAPAVRRSELRT